MITLHQERAFSTVKSSKAQSADFLLGLKRNQHISQLPGAQSKSSKAQSIHFSATWRTINTFLSCLEHNQHISQLPGAQSSLQKHNQQIS
jgi:hypothetical protein